MYRYERFNPISGEVDYGQELHVPLDVHHALGRIEEYILAFNQATINMSSAQTRMEEKVRSLESQVALLAESSAALNRVVTEALRERRELLERQPVPAYRCPECEQVKPVTLFQDDDYICKECRD